MKIEKIDRRKLRRVENREMTKHLGITKNGEMTKETTENGEMALRMPGKIGKFNLDTGKNIFSTRVGFHYV